MLFPSMNSSDNNPAGRDVVFPMSPIFLRFFGIKKYIFTTKMNTQMSLFEFLDTKPNNNLLGILTT